MSPSSRKKAGKDKASSDSRAAPTYVALARRYRPLVFDDVIGQEHVTRTLKNALSGGRVHHAYLFTGSRGVGKTTVARILARVLNDQGEQPTNATSAEPNAGELAANFDLMEIDGASHTSVDDVRQLRENARYLPSQGKRKIYIIDEVHMLSTSAFNALLKTLEEPPPHVAFIFATTEPHKIPATILSRCQRFDFRRVPTALILKHLEGLLQQEGVTVETSGLALIARAAEGSVRDALTLLDQVIAYAAGDAAISAPRVAEVLGIADRRVLFRLSQALLAQDAATALTVVHEVFSAGYDLAHFSRGFLAHLRDLIVVKSCTQPEPLLDASEGEVDELRVQSADVDVSLLEQHFDQMARATDELARSAFPRLLLEVALVEMAHAEPMIPLGDLAQRLEQLEARLSGASGSGRSAGSRGGLPTASGKKTATAKPATTAKPAPKQIGSAPAKKATIDAETMLAQWRELVEQVDPIVGSPFVSGQLMKWSGDLIELGYATGSFELSRATHPQKLEAFQHACSVVLGRAVRVKVHAQKRDETLSPEGAQLSAIQAEDRERREKRHQMQEEAKTHPSTKAVIDRFGAEIASIRTPLDGDR